LTVLYPTYEEMPELAMRMAKDIHRRMETTWHAVGERECAPSFLEMDAVRVFFHFLFTLFSLSIVAILIYKNHSEFLFAELK
jgi:hypothetical protein